MLAILNKGEIMQKEIKARIHSFETLGAVDGPGIRVVIFMQGCSLKCKYCQNRDTWDCKGGKEYSIEQVVTKVEKYRNYIVPNGGVTVSGGEPLIQSSFLIELFMKLKKQGIHTAIDTSGMFQITDEIKELIKLTDLFLLDIKSINDEVCKKLVGFSNKKELEFARYLSEQNKEMWIRQVLVPGYTDKEEDLINLREFIKSLRNVKKVEILPYHDMGKFKWDKIGDPYLLQGVPTANNEDIERAYKILNIKKER